jgi:hypothetical protein
VLILKLRLLSVYLFCSLVCPFSIYSQEKISSSVILKSAFSDPVVLFQQQHIDFISGTKHDLPFAEQLSLRTETENFELARQEYLLRLSVNGRNEIRSQSQLNAATMSAVEMHEKVVLHAALYDRYQAIAAHRYMQKQLAWQKDLLPVYDDKIFVLKKLSSLNDIEIEDLIESEFDYDKLISDTLQTSTKLESIQSSIQALFPEINDEWQLDTLGFISFAGIENVLNRLELSPSFNPKALEKQSEISIIESEYMLEKAESSQVLDFLQLRYRNRPDDLLPQELSLGAAFNIPFKGSSVPETGELLIEKNNGEIELKLYINNLTEMIAAARQEITGLISRYKTIQGQWNDSQGRYTLEHTSSQSVLRPLTVLKARELQLKRQFILLDIENDVIENYLHILDWTGKLSAEPRTNYLSATLEQY